MNKKRMIAVLEPSTSEEIDRYFLSRFGFLPEAECVIYEKIKKCSGFEVELDGCDVVFNNVKEMIKTEEDMIFHDDFDKDFFFATNISGSMYYLKTSEKNTQLNHVFVRDLISSKSDEIDITEEFKGVMDLYL